MSEVIFEEEQIASTPQRSFAPEGMVGFLVRWGVAKSEGQANLILVGVIVLCILFVVVLSSSKSSSHPMPANATPDVLISKQQFLPQ